MYKYLFFLIPLLLLPLISDADALRSHDSETIKNPDGSFTTTLGLPPYIYNNATLNYEPYIFTDTGSSLRVETEHGSVELSKSSCEFSFYKNGRIDTSPLLTDRILAYQSTDATTWSAITSVNSATCSASWDGSELTASRTAAVGSLKYKYILNDYKWKTQLETTNTSGLNDKYFGFAQIVNLNRDTINYGGSQKNLDNFNGQTFDRAWLVNNQGKIIDLLNGFYFDFDLAFDNLNGVQIIDTGAGASRLTFDYSYNAQILQSGQTLVYDPTFNSASATIHTVESTTGAGVACPTPGTTLSSSGVVRKGDSGAGETCTRSAFEFSIAIPQTAVITNVNTSYTISGASASPLGSCTTRAMAAQPSTLSAAALYSDIEDGVGFSALTTNCTVNGAHTDDLGTFADTDLQSAVTAGRTWWAFGVYDSTVRDASDHSTTFSAVTIGVTYNMPPDPVRNFNATTIQSSAAPVSVDLEWLAGAANGGAGPTYQILRCTSSSESSCTQIASQAGTTYSDTNPVDSTLGYYRVKSTDSIGQNAGIFPVNGTLGDNCLSRYPFDWTVTDSCLLGNDGTVTGNTLFTNSSGHVAFNFDGASYVALPNESDYDFTTTSPFSICGWVRPVTGISANDRIIAKQTSIASTGYVLFYTGQTFTFRIHDGTTAFDVNSGGTTVPLNTWTHICATKGTAANKSAMNIYTNGVLQATGTSAAMSMTILNNLSVVIGATSTGTVPFDGQMDDVMIFDTELTAHDVENLYNARIDTKFQPVVTDLSIPTTTIGSAALDWTVPKTFGTTISGYQINYTTPFGDPATIVVNDTASTDTDEIIGSLAFVTPYSFRVGTWTERGINDYGNIANTTTGGESFTIGAITVNQTNTDLVDVRFVRTNVNSTHTDVDVIYPNTFNTTCTISTKFARTSQNYSNLASSPFDANYDQSTFTFVNSTGDQITMYCFDENDADRNGRFLLTWSDFPLLDQFRNFRNGTYGTSGMFGAIDLIALGAIIVGMIGFNRVNESVGAIFAIALIGALAYFEIIQLPTIIFGAIAVIVMVVIGSTKKD